MPKFDPSQGYTGPVYNITQVGNACQIACHVNGQALFMYCCTVNSKITADRESVTPPQLVRWWFDLPFNSVVSVKLTTKMVDVRQEVDEAEFSSKHR